MSLLKELKQSLQGKSKREKRITNSSEKEEVDFVPEAGYPFSKLKKDAYRRNEKNKSIEILNQTYFHDPQAKTTCKSFQNVASKFVDTVSEEDSWRRIFQIDFNRKMKHDPWFHRYVLNQSYDPMEIVHDKDEYASNGGSLNGGNKASPIKSTNENIFQKETFPGYFHVSRQVPLASLDKADVSEENLWGIERDLFLKWITYLKEIEYYNDEQVEVIQKKLRQMHKREPQRSNTCDLKQSKKAALFKKPIFRSDVQHWIFEEMNRYQDIWFADRNRHNEQHLMESYVLHIANHLLKSKRYEWYNDEKKKQVTKGGIKCKYQVKDLTMTPGRVLVLVPFKHTCYQLVSLLNYFMPKILSIRKEEAFEKSFSDEGVVSTFKSGEYQRRFPGKLGDNFVMGITLNHGQLSLMTAPESSDIIVATPLGLFSKYEGNALESLLANVEICIADRLDVIQMQNWENLINVFELMNLPQDSIADTVEISRIKDYSLHGRGKYFRQTIFISEYVSLDMKSLFVGPLLGNVSGKIIAQQYQDGVITTESVPISFEKFKCSNLSNIEDARLKYLQNEVLPRFANDSTAFVLIVVPSSFDMVRLKNHLSNINEKHLSITDEVGNAEKVIEKAKKDLITYVLISERQWYFHETKSQHFTMNRYIFYSLPENVELFRKFLQRADTIYKKDSECEVICLFHKIDIFNLEKAIGEKEAKRLVTSRETIFEL